MAARWVPVDLVLAVAEQREDAAWSRYQHGHRVAAFAAKAAEPPGSRRPWAGPAEPCTWQATEPPGSRRPWAGLRDREVAQEAARVVADLGLRPGCRVLGIDPRTAAAAWRRHGIPRPELGRGRYSTLKG